MSLKNIIRKSIASLGAISLVFSHCSLCGIGLLEVIAENASVPEVGIEWTNEKYVQYNYSKMVEVDGQEKEVEVKGVAVQSKLAVYPTYEQDTYLPTESVEVNVSLPTMNGYLPEKSMVVEALTKSTTGKEVDTNINQNYDSDSGLLTVSYENTPDENENIYMAYVENAKDEFEIIYTYPAEAYTGNEEETMIQSTVNARMTFKTENESVTTENTKSFEIVEKGNNGDVLTFDVTELEEKIYKGFMYSNAQNQTSYDTEYKTVSTFAVLNSDVVDEISMELKDSEFVLNDEEETKISANGNIVYKETQINKSEFDKILGQDGALEIYTNEKLFATIKYIEFSENEEIQKRLVVIYSDGEVKDLSEETIIAVEYPENILNLKIKTSKPIAEGFIHFENTNTIKASSDYGLKVEDIKYIAEERIVNNYSRSTKIRLLEPETKISVTSSNTNFSTLQNSTTTLTITLDDTNASAKLFNNPIITVKLPEGIESGNVSSLEIVNGNGLTIKNSTGSKNIINIELEGKQTSYDLTNVSGGVSIVMDIENMDYKDTLPTHEDKIEVTCTQGAEEIVTDCNVNIVSKSGLLMLSTLTGFDGNNTLSSIDSEVRTVEIATNSEQKEVLQTLNLVNNYDDTITNVQVLGKLEYSNEKVTSTLDLELTKPIEVSGGKVYYSNNINATYDDKDWTEEFTANAKAYKLELENNKLESKSSTELKLYVKIPANLEHNQAIYMNCNAIYSYNEIAMQENKTIGMITAKDELTQNNNLVNLSMMSLSGEKVPVNLSISPIISQEYVHSGQLVTYRIRVSNNGEEDLNNLLLISNISDNAIYTYYKEIQSLTGNYSELTQDSSIKQKEWEISSLKAGEILELDMLVTMDDVNEEQEVINSVKIEYNEQTTSSSPSRMLLKPAKLRATLTITNDADINATYKAGSNIAHYIKIKNTTDKVLNNIKVQYDIPEELQYLEGGIQSFDEVEGYKIIDEVTLNERLFEYDIDKLNVGEEKVIQINTKVKQLTEKYEKYLNTIAKVCLDDDIYETEVKTINIKQAAFNISLSVDTKGKELLQKDDEATYIINVKNIGESSGVINILDQIPENLKVEKIEYSINDEEINSIEYVKQNVELEQVMYANDILTLKIITKVRNIEVSENTILTEINKATLKSGELEITSNEATINIKPVLKPIEENEEGTEGNDGDAPVDNSGDRLEDSFGDISEDNQGNNSGNNSSDELEDNKENEAGNNSSNNPEVIVKLYSISGIAWIDENRNGKKDENETTHQGMVVSLVDTKTGKFALDSNGNRIKTVTDNKGQYIFENVKGGSYTVIFEFNTDTYTVTTYKKDNISQELNSDAILTNVNIEGELKLAGVTDNIELDSNKENIDIGLIEKLTFDLSLDKQITEITVINSKGTEVYEYEDGEMAKVDLVAKYMNGANVIVNYTFTVVNKGEVSGYVNSLVDNLPSGLEFSSDLNKDWYKGSDGNLYTTALSKAEIKPGESTQIELVLTKNMTEDNAGIFPNSAKLEKISNLQNIQEKEEAKENNQSSANLVISIKTGAIAMYVGITIVCLVIILAGTYLIKKKVLNRGI